MKLSHGRKGLAATGRLFKLAEQELPLVELRRRKIPLATISECGPPYLQ